MAWTFTRAELEADRDKAAAEAADYPNKVDNQQLGRALRWLDYDVAAVQEAFRGGAAAMKANVFDKGPAPDGPLWEQALNALHSGEGRDEAREAVIGALAKERGLPSYTAPSMTLWDLLEELYGPQLTHAEMLARSGLLSE